MAINRRSERTNISGPVSRMRTAAAKKKITRKKVAAPAKRVTAKRKTTTKKKRAFREVVVKKSTRKGPAKKAAKKKVTRKKRSTNVARSPGTTASTRKVTKKKAGKKARAGRKPLIVPVSATVERLTARLDKSSEMLANVRTRQSLVREKMIQAVEGARRTGTTRALDAADRSRIALGKVNDRVKTLRTQIRNVRKSLQEAVKHDTAVTRRKHGLSQAAEKFQAKWLRDYDRKVARRLRAAAARKRAKRS